MTDKLAILIAGLIAGAVLAYGTGYGYGKSTGSKETYQRVIATYPCGKQETPNAK